MVDNRKHCPKLPKYPLLGCSVQRLVEVLRYKTNTNNGNIYSNI